MKSSDKLKLVLLATGVRFYYLYRRQKKSLGQRAVIFVCEDLFRTIESQTQVMRELSVPHSHIFLYDNNNLYLTWSNVLS